MTTQQIIDAIARSPGSTPVTVWLQADQPLAFPGTKQFFGGEGLSIVFGDWEAIRPVLEENAASIRTLQVENDGRNTALPLLDKKDLPARIEPGAIIRSPAQIGENAVIMMGAILNVGAAVGPETMIDMGAVLGARATVGSRCHIGAGAVLAGVLEPPSADPVVIEDDVLIGANAVVLEGIRVGRGAVVAAGAVVTEDVPPNTVAAGTPARFVKWVDDRTRQKTQLLQALRALDPSGGR